MADAFDDQVAILRREREDAARELMQEYIEATDEGAAGFLFVPLSMAYHYLDTDQRTRLTSEGNEALRHVPGADGRLSRLARLPP